MTAVDYVLLAILVVSGMISLIRGFVKESLSLVTWIVAMWAAIFFHDAAVPLVSEYLPNTTLQQIASFAVVFIGVVLLGGVVSLVVSMLVASSGLTGTDRALGVVFGLARGVLIGAIVIMLAGATEVAGSQPWEDSRLRPYLQPVADWLAEFAGELDTDDLIDAARELAPDGG